MMPNIFKTILIFIASIFCANSSYALPTSYYTSNSKLNSGHWVKIKVSQIGMQEISHDQLREMGFSDPSKVCVYGYGGTLLTKNTFDKSFPDDLPAQPVYYADDKIIFYGEPDLRINFGKDASKIEILRNVYSSAGYYFLSDCNPSASQIPTASKYNLSNIISREYHNDIVYIENEADNPGQAGAIFFDKSLINSPTNYSFKISKPYKPNDEAAYFYYSYAAKVSNYTSLTVAFDHPDSLITKTKHNQVIPSSLEMQYYYTSNGEMNFKLIDTPDTTYSFSFSIPTSSSPTYAAIDYAYLSYRRQNNFENESQMRMSFLASVNQNTNFVISNANENIQVWNVTNPLNVYPHATKFTETTKRHIGSFDKTYSYSSTGNACLIAFDPTKTMHQVEIVGSIDNQNLHNIEVPEMVIITNKLCKPYAEQLAQLHRDYQKMNVAVIDQQKIFNEYSSGTPSAMAYRRFLKMLHDRNSSKFKYLLLFGEGSWDNRGVMFPKEDRLLTYQAEDVQDTRSAAKAFCGDSYFGMLNDNYISDDFYKTDVQLGIGRIPANSPINAQAAVNKIIKYFQNPPTSTISNQALILADEGDGNGHIIQQEENLDSILLISPATTCTRAYCSLYPTTDLDATEARNLIIQSLKKGQWFFSFAGHGGATSFTKKNLWNIASIKEANYSHSPIAMFATCDAFAFDRKDGGMAESSLYKENGGCIAIVGASRTVYMQFNQYINRAFTCELYKANNKDLIGDVFRKARNRAAIEIADRTLGVNTMCYNLAGDPALPLYKPSLNVITNTINDIAVDNSTYHDILPLTKNTITGQINNSNGTLQESFNGTITLSLFDGPILYSSYTKNKNQVVEYNKTTLTTPTKSYYSSDSLSLVLDECLLTEITVPVTNGKFEATLVSPAPQKPNSYNRISYFAYDKNKATSASGTFNLLRVPTVDEEKAINDTSAPIIEECYINDPSFSNGDIVESQFTLYAKIAADETGINNSAKAIGTNTTLTLDGRKSFPDINTALVSNADGTYSLSFDISQIEDGRHTLTLSVADNAGNRTNASINFVVIDKSATAELTIDETPARTEATFNLTHNFIDEPSGRLIIEDNSGKTIYTKQNCKFPYTWDLKDTNGNAVSDGNYKAYVILNGGKQYGSSPKIPVIVIK